MTPEQKQKLIKQAQQIAKNGCDGVFCTDCVLDPQCDGGFDVRGFAHGFLAGIEFKKGEPEEKLTPCPECKKPRGEEENGAYICPCPHCGDEAPF